MACRIHFQKGQCILFVLLCSTISFGAEILKIDKFERMIAVTSGRRAWVVNDYLCVVHDDKREACGSVVRATQKGAILKIEFRGKERIEVGDEVILVESAVHRQTSPATAGKPASSENAGAIPDPSELQKSDTAAVPRPDAVAAAPKKESLPPPPGAAPPPTLPSSASRDDVENDLRKLNPELPATAPPAELPPVGGTTPPVKRKRYSRRRVRHLPQIRIRCLRPPQCRRKNGGGGIGSDRSRCTQLGAGGADQGGNQRK